MNLPILHFSLLFMSFKIATKIYHCLVSLLDFSEMQLLWRLELCLQVFPVTNTHWINKLVNSGAGKTKTHGPFVHRSHAGLETGFCQHHPVPAAGQAGSGALGWRNTQRSWAPYGSECILTILEVMQVSPGVDLRLSFLAKGGDVGHTSSYYFHMRNTTWSFSWKNVAFK